MASSAHPATRPRRSSADAGTGTAPTAAVGALPLAVTATRGQQDTGAATALPPATGPAPLSPFSAGATPLPSPTQATLSTYSPFEAARAAQGAAAARPVASRTRRAERLRQADAGVDVLVAAHDAIGPFLEAEEYARVGLTCSTLSALALPRGGSVDGSGAGAGDQSSSLLACTQCSARQGQRQLLKVRGVTKHTWDAVFCRECYEEVGPFACDMPGCGECTARDDAVHADGGDDEIWMVCEFCAMEQVEECAVCADCFIVGNEHFHAVDIPVLITHFQTGVEYATIAVVRALDSASLEALSMHTGLPDCPKCAITGGVEQALSSMSMAAAEDDSATFTAALQRFISGDTDSIEFIVAFDAATNVVIVACQPR